MENKRKIQGIIVSDKMDKTVVVKVSRTKKHPKYLKRYKVDRKYKVHDEKNEYRVDDLVVIEETRPISKEKRWRVVELLRRPETEEGPEEAAE